MATFDLIVETSRYLTAADQSALADHGLRVAGAAGDRRYRVRGTTDSGIDDVEALDFVVAARPFAATAKLDRTLRRQARGAAAAVAPAGLAAAAAAAPEPLEVLVSLDAGADSAATVTALGDLGEVKESGPRRALVAVDAGRLEELAALPGVLNAEVKPEIHVNNNVARGLTQVEPAAGDLSLDGSGEIVGVADSGLDTGVDDATMNDDFEGRIVNIRATVNKAPLGVADGADLQNHGTHVSGSILGDGSNSNGNILGMAPAAQITMLSMGPDNSTSLSVPLDLTTGVFQDAYGDGARLHNNSWSATGSAGAYSALSTDVDEFTRDNPDMLILFAAGNDGDGAGSVTAPGTAKNCLTVGASESVRPLPATITLDPNLQDHDFNPVTPDQNVPLAAGNWDQQADDADDIAGFSGRGPTDDGRIAPDVVAPGTFILSCRSQVSTADVGPDGLPHGAVSGLYADDADGVATHAEAVGRGLPGGPFFGSFNENTPAAPAGSGPLAQQNYFYNSGTSMATPVTCGATALLRQYLRQQRGIADPSAALMKAFLVNGATVPAGDPNTPDNTRGFGWLNLENTLRPAPTGQQGYSDDVDLAVATGDVRTFQVQLAAVGDPLRVTLAWTDAPGSGLQNRLYLRVIPPGGAAIDGDITAFPNPSNNVQRVHIDAPVAGTYTIEVHGVEVLQGIDAHLPDVRQDFALAIINGIGFSPEEVDVCEVIDRSGSMGFYGYMTPVRERSKQLVDILRIGDRVGVAAFDHGPSLVHPVIPIAGFADQTAVKTAIDGIMVGGATSIGAGLQQGQALLTAGGDPGHPQALVLLSDGHENTPPWVGGPVTDSPPAWYGGPDFTEVLPALPAATRVYTVSLGVQSDALLLQEIATATGGTFHAIHSAADVAELHEIYVHLQALVGGEEVIASGSDDVDGFGFGGSRAATAAAAGNGGGVDRALLADLRGLTDLRNVEPAIGVAGGRFRGWRLHRVPIDDSVTTATFLTSWHDPASPVRLSLISPSRQIIRSGSGAHFNVTGSSYQFFRVEKPEPGDWWLAVTRSRDLPSGSSDYTWGVTAETPLGIRVELPKGVGRRSFQLEAKLAGRDEVARSLRFRSSVQAPRRSLAKLVGKCRGRLKKIDLDVEPDTPTVDPDLLKLVALDVLRRNRGRRTIFKTARRKLRLLKAEGYATKVEAAVAGLYTLNIRAQGRTREGFRYRRQTRFNAVTKA